MVRESERLWPFAHKPVGLSGGGGLYAIPLPRIGVRP
jgi:hypothetical protein